LKILIVTQYFWPENFRVNDLALGLKQRGHEVEVLTGLPNYPLGKFYPGYRGIFPAAEQYQGIPIKRVPLIARGNRKNWQLAANYASFALLASLMGPLLCRLNYDVIFVYEPSPVTVALPAIVLKTLKRTPTLLWVQDLWPESLAATGAVRSPWALSLVRSLVDFIYRRCDRVLVSSKGFTSHVLASGITADRVKYLPNWAENLYHPLPVAADYAQREMPHGFKAMFAGNIGSAQSFETIIAAAERLRHQPEIQWVVFGDGNMKSWVTEQIRQRGLEKQFHLLGHRPAEQMPDYFATADALLVTLRAEPAFALTVPSKVQSYLACGKPIIAALNGEGADIVIESGAGISCSAGNPDKLAEAVLTLYRMPAERRKAMGAKARKYFESHFEREMLLDQLQKWMREVVDNKPCAY
jgi:glycosyltransferase involved in cell wall biosynthesis